LTLAAGERLWPMIGAIGQTDLFDQRKTNPIAWFRNAASSRGGS
jgi:hypothetical protein